MKILLTNDDGIDAPGLKVLRDVMVECGHDVWVVAPSSNRSGASCSVNIFKRQLLVCREKNVYALDGTPIDCVISGIKGGYLPSVPDVVISGINNDGNIGTDIIYSGTCGAARQACLYGVPGIALSAEKIPGTGENGVPRQYKFENLACFAAKNLEKLIGLCGNLRNKEEGDGYTFFVNVNAPSIDSYKGVRFADIARRDYQDRVEISRDVDGRIFSSCIGDGAMKTFGRSSSDYALVKDGYVSVSVLYAEAVANSSYKDGWF